MFTVVIPAFEEAETIGAAVRAVASVAGSEVIVVDDGSRDATAAEARRAGARVIELGQNRGKGGAMEAGVRESSHDVIAFLDADVTGMTEDKLLALVRPVRDGAVMCVGVRHAIFHRMNRSLRWVPAIAKLSGQRCIRRRVWEAARDYGHGYRAEVALNYLASRMGAIEYIYLPGLSHRIKERKRGLWTGLQQRLKMIAHIFAGALAVRLRQRGSAWKEPVSGRSSASRASLRARASSHGSDRPHPGGRGGAPTHGVEETRRRRRRRA